MEFICFCKKDCELKSGFQFSKPNLILRIKEAYERSLFAFYSLQALGMLNIQLVHAP